MRPRPLVVAITGGIGAGKSEALAAFARHGAAVASADDIVHRLYRRPDVRDALVARWGSRVLDRQGELDRAAVGRIVFSDREELAWLEALVHPLVVEEQARWREELGDRARLAVIEVPLLYETGAEERFDAVVAITAPAALRRERARVGLEGREDRLLPDDEKTSRADFAYVNDGGLESLDAFVATVVQELEGRRT